MLRHHPPEVAELVLASVRKVLEKPLDINGLLRVRNGASIWRPDTSTANLKIAQANEIFGLEYECLVTSAKQEPPSRTTSIKIDVLCRQPVPCIASHLSSPAMGTRSW